MKWIFRSLIALCIGIGIAFGIGAYVQSGSACASAAGCGVNYLCRGRVIGEFCFNGCPNTSGCSVFVGGAGKKCCRTLIYLCSDTETQGVRRSCVSGGCAGGAAE